MRTDLIFPCSILLLMAGASVTYFFQGQPAKGAYWLFSMLINSTVTFWMKG
jgi:hypothetical protein